MNAPNTQASAPLSTMLKASWGIGGLGTTSMLYLINMFVVFFLVRHVGVAAGIAGTLLATTRFYDALINPVIGRASDDTTSRWGRRRPWMLAGAILAPLGCLAIFNPPSIAQGPTLYVAIFAALALYFTGYSLFSIPCTALGAEMTDDYRERAGVMAWRTFWVYVAGIVITAGAPAMIARLGGDRSAYSAMSMAAAAVIAFSMLWVVAFTGPARVTVRSSVKVPALASLRTALSNKPFMIVLLMKMMGQLGTAFSGAVSLFFMADVLLQGESAMAMFGLVANVVGVAAVPLWGRMLRHFERRPMLIAILSASALTSLSWLLGRPNEPQLVFMLRAALIGGLGSGAVLLAMSMVADTIEYDRLKTGLRREGMFVGAFELMQTTSFVIAPLLAGLALSAAGYKPGHVAASAQPQSALEMIRLAMSVLPALCSGIGVALAWHYRLTADVLDQLRAAAGEESAATPAGAAQASPPEPVSMNANASRAVTAGSSSTSM